MDKSAVSSHYAALEQLYENGTTGWVEATMGDILTLASTHDSEGEDLSLTDIASTVIALEQSDELLSENHSYMVFQSRDVLGVTILFERKKDADE